jgi:hypothetical protein
MRGLLNGSGRDTYAGAGAIRPDRRGAAVGRCHNSAGPVDLTASPLAFARQMAGLMYR